MVYLVAAILCSFSLAIIIKINEKRNADRLLVLGSSYVVSAILSWSVVIYQGHLHISSSTLFLGMGGGLFWSFSFFIFMWGVNRYGISITGAIARLSLSVPVMIALIFLGEALSLSLAAGLAATFLAFLLISPISSNKLSRFNMGAIWFFPLMVLCLGMSDFWMNLFKIVGEAEENFFFISLLFSFAAVFCGIVMFVKKTRFTVDGIKRGILLGIPNFGSAIFLLESLKHPAFVGQSAIVYSIYSSSVLVLTFSAGAIIWKERVSMANIFGVIVAIVAIVLLNIA